jgi:hypothetical protein
MSELFENFETRISDALCHRFPAAQLFSKPVDLARTSSVLFLLGDACAKNGQQAQPCLILNKRSEAVSQPGDLCCPGGGLYPHLDLWLSRLLTLPGFALFRWRHKLAGNSRQLSMFLAAGLREGFEEMRLNPLRVRFLGMLAPYRLVMFRRWIYPMVVWVDGQRRFRLNGEVERIITIPLRHLLDPARYGRYHLEFPLGNRLGVQTREFPCHVIGRGENTEILWGATYRITVAFLNAVFGFQPPDMACLPVYRGRLSKRYPFPAS